MKGFQLSFYTQQARRHGKQLMVDWLLEAAKECAVPGATVMPAAKGFGHSGQMHSAGFIDMADQPMVVIMTATAEQCETLIAKVKSEGVQVFYVKAAVEFELVESRAP